MNCDYIDSLKQKLESAGYKKRYVTVCCEYAKKLLINDLPVIFDLEHFCLLIGAKKDYITKVMFAEDMFYNHAIIPKKSGGYRKLSIPCLELKYIQRWILDNILVKINVSEYATGFKHTSSIVKNAQMHLNKECVINIDIKDFFSTISFIEVFKIFSYYGYTKEISYILAKLCTYNDCLPQGSPASPYLSNIVCLKLDKRLSSLACSYGAKYTRYADDITISGKKGIIKVLTVAEEIINDEGFNVNRNKTRVAYQHQRQEVTGLIVNNSDLRVSKRYKRNLWQQIYYCQKYGVKSHLQKTENDKSFYKEHMYGKGYFVNMVEPIEGQKILDELDKIEWDY